ncbi:MAG: hypothetical protein K8S20_16910 [Chloroflexi bacterium]|nr:hypothetical protein [Chloroflexota bacterium]
MSDMTLIAEDILNTIHAIEEAHAATTALQNNVDTGALNAFRLKMLALQERLEKLKVVLDNEEAFAVDELVDAISNAYTGHPAKYRKTPRMNA